MNKINLKTLYPHIIAIFIFFIISIAYFPQVLENKTLSQSDVRQHLGMAKEILDYRDKTGEFSLWTNSMFAGMPSYFIVTPPSSSIFAKIHRLLILNDFRPVGYLFLLMLGFYISLLVFRINPWLSIAGAIAFAFSTNFVSLIATGHLTKVQAIGYLPPVVAGVYLAYRGRILTGALITGVFLSMQLLVNHLQMTYYAFMIILVLGIIELISAIKNKHIPAFLKATGILIIAVLLAVATNITNFWLTYEYSKYSIRGKSELTSGEGTKTSGLDPEYVTAWSNGIDETLTMLIPNFKGGSSNSPLGENSETYELFRKAQGPQYARQVIQHLPLYWGSKPFTSGPTYLGAGIFFLFILGLFLIKGPVKWWLLIISVLAIMLSWGRNFMVLTNLFLDYFPGYNKFRDVTNLLVITQFAFPLLAMLTLQKIFFNNIPRNEFYKALKYSVYGVGGLILIFILIPGAFYDFTSQTDTQYINNNMQAFVDALKIDRKMLLRYDSIRSLVFVLLTAGFVYFTFTKKLKVIHGVIIFAGISLIDLWMIDKRFLNKNDFIPKRQAKEAFQPYQADLEILNDKDLYYRVYDLTSDPFVSTRASYFHKSLGGYHGAKLRRYQDLIDYHLRKNNMNVINMLNTKYFIIPGKDSPPVARLNNGALGNVWFVNKCRIVENADEEIEALNSFNPSNEAIVDKRFESQLETIEFVEDTTASIMLTSYRPNGITYVSESHKDQLAIFSDIYYDKGWNVVIDGEPASYFRADYILRAMIIPAGKHTIEFSFEPPGYTLGRPIGFISSLVLLVLLLGIAGLELKKTYFSGKTEES